MSSSYHDPCTVWPKASSMSPSPIIQVQILRNHCLGVSNVHINRNSIWNTLVEQISMHTCVLKCVLALLPGSSPAFCHILYSAWQIACLVPRLLPNFLWHTIQYATKVGEEPGNEADVFMVDVFMVAESNSVHIVGGLLKFTLHHGAPVLIHRESDCHKEAHTSLCLSQQMVGMKPPMIRHVKVLCLEFKKATPNKHTVAELMKLTFTVRRQRILTAPVSMKSLLKTYPPFRQYN